MSDADKLIRDAFTHISSIAFDSDSTVDASDTLNRICSVLYSTEQCLDNMVDIPQQQEKQ